MRIVCIPSSALLVISWSIHPNKMLTLLNLAILHLPLASALVLSSPTTNAIVQPAAALQNLTQLLASPIKPWESRASTSSLLRPNASLDDPHSITGSCDGQRFGYALNTYTCTGAIGDMLFARDTTSQRTWFNRDVDRAGVPLPRRFMSCEFFHFCGMPIFIMTGVTPYSEWDLLD